MLKLRRAVVVDSGPLSDAAEQDLKIELTGAAGEIRAAIGEDDFVGT